MLTLDDLDPPSWPAADSGSGLVATCHALRRKPIVDFTTEDLRVMIGQRIATPILLPIAVKLLASDPLVSGDCYPGDLFAACVRAYICEARTLTQSRDSLVRIAMSILEADTDDPLLLDAARSMLAQDGG